MKHRAKRKLNYFRFIGRTLVLASLFGIALFALLHRGSEDTVTPPSPHKIAVAPSFGPTYPDTPPRPTAQQLAADAMVRQESEKAAEVAKAQAEARAAAEKAAQEKAAAQAAIPKPAPTPAPTPPPAPTPAPSPARGTSTGAYKAYAATKVDATQMSCLDTLWTHESSWNPTADNPTSTAYGIPQFLDSTWATVGYQRTSDPYTQIDAGLVYIARTYQTPCGAWGFWQANNYY